MAIEKSPANKDAMGSARKTTNLSAGPRRTPTAVQKFNQYREAGPSASGRTSSGKAMSGPKAGRGSTC